MLATDLRIGVGEVQARLDQAPESRRTAELALRALLFTGSSLTSARVDEVAGPVALVQILDALCEVALPQGTPVARLAAYDARQGGGVLVATLRA